MIRLPYRFKTTYHKGISCHMKIYQLYIGQEYRNEGLLYNKKCHLTDLHKTTYHKGRAYNRKFNLRYLAKEHRDEDLKYLNGSSHRVLMYHKEILIEGFQQDLEHQGVNRQDGVLVMSVQLIRSLEGIYHKGLQYMMHREQVIVLVQIKIGMHSLLVP